MNLKNTISALYEWGLISSATTASLITQKGHDATGWTGRSIRGSVFITDDSVGIAIGGRTSEGIPILSVVDKGRKPGRVPPSYVIENWIRARGIQPRNEKGRFSSKPRDYKRVAFAIARVIGEKGTMKQYNGGGAEVVSESLAMTIPTFDRIVGDALFKDLGDEFKDALKNL